MTTQQTAADERIRQKVLEHDGLRSEQYEFKQFEASEDERTGLVFVVTEVGRKNDEGTMASVLCRKHRHICVGRKGGMKLLNGKQKHVIGSRVFFAETR